MDNYIINNSYLSQILNINYYQQMHLRIDQYVALL